MLMDVARGWNGSRWNGSMAIVEAVLDGGIVVGEAMLEGGMLVGEAIW